VTVRRRERNARTGERAGGTAYPTKCKNARKLRALVAQAVPPANRNFFLQASEPKTEGVDVNSYADAPASAVDTQSSPQCGPLRDTARTRRAARDSVAMERRGL